MLQLIVQTGQKTNMQMESKTRISWSGHAPPCPILPSHQHKQFLLQDHIQIKIWQGLACSMYIPVIMYQLPLPLWLRTMLRHADCLQY